MMSYRELYGLRMNPFPLQGSFPLDTAEEKMFAYCYTTNERTKRAIDDIVEKIKRGEPLPVVLIAGDYGYGKTHLLRYLYYRVKEEVTGAIPVYIKTVREPSALALYREIIRGFEQIASRRLIYRAAKNILGKPKEYGLITSIFPDMGEIIKHLAGERIEALRWLFAVDLPYDYLNRLGVISGITENNTVRALQALTKLVYFGLGTRLVILIDELEEAIVGRENREVTYFYKVLRDIVDTTWNEAYYIMAVTPVVLEGTKAMKSLSPALISRLSSGGLIRLSRLDKDMFVRLVEKYLNQFREPKVRGFYAGLFPFTREALLLIYEHTRGVPRSTLQLLGKILFLAAKKRKKEIDYGFVQDVIEGRVTEKEEKEEIREIIEEATRAIEEEIVQSKGDYDTLMKNRIKNVLSSSPDRSMTLTKLARQIKATYDIALKYVMDLEKEGLVILKKKGKGYRVYWRGP